MYDLAVGQYEKSHAIISYRSMYLRHHIFRHLCNHPITWSGHNVQNHVGTYFTYFSQSAHRTLEWGTMCFYTDFDCDMVAGANKSSLSIFRNSWHLQRKFCGFMTKERSKVKSQAGLSRQEGYGNSLQPWWPEMHLATHSRCVGQDRFHTSQALKSYV